MKRLALVLLAAAMLPAGAAMARQDAPGPPSGIVIHLFGSNSVFNNIVPGTEGGGAAPAANKPAATPPAATANPPAGTSVGTPAATGNSSAGTPASTPAGAASGNADESVGGILHEMFVTGDPNEPASERLSKGRPGTH